MERQRPFSVVTSRQTPNAKRMEKMSWIEKISFFFLFGFGTMKPPFFQFLISNLFLKKIISWVKKKIGYRLASLPTLYKRYPPDFIFQVPVFTKSTPRTEKKMSGEEVIELFVYLSTCCLEKFQDFTYLNFKFSKSNYLSPLYLRLW